MASLTQVSRSLQQLFTTVAEEAARTTGCVQRQRVLSGASWVQTLVFGCLGQPAPSLTTLAQTAAALGVAVSPQAVAQRFTPATVACLEQVLGAAVATVVTATPAAIPLLGRFAAVELVDTSTIALPPALAAGWPGCGNGRGQPAAALKLGVRLDLRHGTLSGPVLVPGRTHDRAMASAAVPLPAGTLRLADLGFWSVADLATMTAAEGYWLSRLQAQTAVLDPDGTRLDLDARRARLARAVGTRWRAGGRADRLSLAEARVLARARWQIELLFKLGKHHGRLAHQRSVDPWRVLSELYATLIALVIQHWTLLLGCWQCPARSLVRAAAVGRRHALVLAWAARGGCARPSPRRPPAQRPPQSAAHPAEPVPTAAGRRRGRLT